MPVCHLDIQTRTINPEGTQIISMNFNFHHLIEFIHLSEKFPCQQFPEGLLTLMLLVANLANTK